jgi:hypothetical protein
MEPTAINKKILESFHLMWDLHPFPVMLLRANRDIVAVNAVAKQMNISEGVKCFSLSGRKAVCDHCRADEALAQGNAKTIGKISKFFNEFAQVFWTPLAGEEKLYLHYANNINEFVRPELSQTTSQPS